MTDAMTLAQRNAKDANELYFAIRRAITAAVMDTPDGWPLRGEHAGGRSGVSDPVGEMAIRRTTGTGSGYGPSDMATAVLERLVVIAEQMTEIRGLIAKWDRAVITDADHAPRCTCDDPLCERRAEMSLRNDGTYGLRYSGLSATCYQRKRRAEMGAVA